MRLTPFLILFGLCASSGYAQADVGRVRIDIDNESSRRSVTYAYFDSFKPVLTAEQIALLENSPSNQNTADMSKALLGTRIFEAQIVQVFETPRKEVEAWDVYHNNLYVNCDDESVYLWRSERIFRENGEKRDKFELAPAERMITGPQKWQKTLTRHVCHQQDWRRQAVQINYEGFDENQAGSYLLRCADYAMEKIGLECNLSSSYEYLRWSASLDLD